MKIAAAYIPVVHKGHQEFCRKVKPDILYILGGSLVSEFPVLERDIRALPPKDIASFARAISLAPDIKILEKENIPNMKKEATSFVFSDDDVMRSIAEKYFSDMNVSFESTFLRWDKMNSITKTPVNEDSIVSVSDLDKQFINLARDVSKKSSDWWRQTGAVIVKEDGQVFAAHNQHKPSEHSPYIDGDPRANFDAGAIPPDTYTAIHAEADVIAQAAKQGIPLKGASVYLTTFPCPACSMQIIAAGIKKVYYADGYSVLNAERNFKIAGVELIQVKEN